MGMYTELFLRCELKHGTQTRVLQHMLDEEWDLGDEDHAHPFFDTHRWVQIGQMNSAYFPGDSIFKMAHDWVFDRTNLTLLFNMKNYDNEIEKFLDWLMPAVDGYEDDILGWVLYEEAEEPTIIRLTGEPS